MIDTRFISVSPEDDGQRLDRWLKKRIPELPYALSQKLIRKGAIRIDGKKGKADTRLKTGQEIRIPPLEDKPEKLKAERKFTYEDKKYIESLVIYDDGDLVVFNKPSGLASQGGGGVEHHIDEYFPLLIKDEMSPRLIHRLDRDTSGLLLAARSPEAVRKLGKTFKNRQVKKIYWAVLLGVPEQRDGTVQAPIAKTSSIHKDRMVIDDENGKFSETDFFVVDTLGKEACFTLFMPRTGRTHQIRVHASDALNTPVLGDSKYGGDKSEELEGQGVANRLHLHARRLVFDHPLKKGEKLDVTAELPDDLVKSWKVMGFDPSDKSDPF